LCEVGSGNQSIIELLIQNGANPSIHINGNPFLIWCLQSNLTFEMVKFVVSKGCDVQVKCKDGNT
jgi:hypothetical protein